MAELISNDGVDKATKLRTLEAIQKNFRENNEAFDNEETELDSDDDEDLSSRLEGIDLEDTDKVWSLLTSEERRDFQKKIESGDIYSLIPPSLSSEEENEKYWWEINFPCKKVVDLDDEKEENFKLHQNCPPIFTPNIMIDTSSSSPLIKYNLVNILMAYTFVYKHLSWNIITKAKKKSEDFHEFSSLLLELASSLKRGENFTSFEQAVESVVAMTIQSPSSDLKKYANEAKENREDLLKLIRGPGATYEFYTYIHAALSDIKSILEATVSTHIKNEIFTKKDLKFCVKKIEFYICWLIT